MSILFFSRVFRGILDLRRGASSAKTHSRLDKGGASDDYSRSDERVIFQTLPATTVSGSLYYSEFQGHGGTRGG